MNKYFKFSLVIAWFTIIVVIFSNNILHVFGDSISTEKRVLATCPTVEKATDARPKDYLRQLKNYPGDFDKCFNDHFSFRNNLVSLVNLTKIKVFNTSPVGNIEIGKDGWYFYNTPGMKNTYDGSVRYSENDKLKINEVLDKRTAFLKNLGIDYTLMVAPDKLTMYPEKLPPTYKKFSSETALDDYSGILDSTKNLNFVNLKPFLEEEKKSGDIFFKTDSHWNSKGALKAYEQLVHIYQDNPKIKFQQISTTNAVKRNYAGDLSYFMNTLDYIYDADQTYFLTSTNTATRIVENLQYTMLDGHKVEYEKWENSNKTLPKLVLIGDSFTDAMRKWLAENFSEVNYYKNTNGFAYQEISKDKPDLVLQIFNEAQLVNVPNE